MALDDGFGRPGPEERLFRAVRKVGGPGFLDGTVRNAQPVQRSGPVRVYRVESAAATALRAATIIVAASDSLDTDSADYVCTGTGDESTINSALSALSSVGGRVLLLEGTYSLDGQITCSEDNVTLEGQGDGTHLSGSETSALVTISNSFDRFRLLNLRITQNGASYAVDIAAPYSRIEGCTIDGTGWGIVLTGGYSKALGNTVLSTGLGSLIQGEHVEVANNHFTAALNSTMLTVNTGSIYCRVVDNTLETTGTGINLSVAGDRHIIAGNYIKGGQNGINLSAPDFCVVDGNSIYLARQHGIDVGASSDDNQITNNLVVDSGQQTANTYDHIHTGNGADRNNIQGNTCRGTSAKYAIEIGTGTDNFVTNNDVKNGYTTAAIQDGGTTTTTTAGNRT